jgi:hypothetical protein
MLFEALVGVNGDLALQMLRENVRLPEDVVLDTDNKQ